jgi:virginiamycin B lyase
MIKRKVFGLLATAAIISSSFLPLASNASGSISEYAIPTANSLPRNIALGPDGALWFSEAGGGAIGRISTSGSITNEYPIANSSPQGIVAGPDNAMWFTDSQNNSIGRISTSGSISEFTLPTANAGPIGIASGSDGNLWFTEAGSNGIGRITTSGSITEFSIPTANTFPEDIAAGSDGALWFIEPNANNIGRITTSGSITEYNVDPVGGSDIITSITSGPDGALWFLERNNSRIDRMTTSGTITNRFNAGVSNPENLTTGPDGALWLTTCSSCGASNDIGRVTTSGATTSFSIPTPNAFSLGITSGPDDALWFTELNGNKIGRISAATLNAPTGLNGASPTNQPVIGWNSVTGADHYNVYRDSNSVGSSSTTSFTDSSATEGSHTYSVTAVDLLGSESPQSSPITILVDKTAPTIGALSWSSNPKATTASTTLTASTSDSLSGVAGGEYFIGSDPGVGNGTAASYSGGNLSATIGASLNPGV